MLHALGYWRPELSEIPAQPEFDVDRELMTSDPKRFEELVEAYGTER